MTPNAAVITYWAVGWRSLFHQMEYSKESINQHRDHSYDEYARALTQPPDAAAYADKSKEAQQYEHKHWIAFISNPQDRKECIGCDTASIKAGSFKSHRYFLQSWERLLSDVLIIKKANVIFTGSSIYWRVYTRLVDSAWVGDDKDVELAIVALYNMFLHRTREIGEVKNFVFETDVYSEEFFVVDIKPHEECLLCKPEHKDTELCGLLPSLQMGAQPKTAFEKQRAEKPLEREERTFRPKGAVRNSLHP